MAAGRTGGTSNAWMRSGVAYVPCTASPQRRHRSGRWSTNAVTSSADSSVRPLPSCPSRPPHSRLPFPRPRRPAAGPSVDGGFDEFRDVSPSSRSSSAIRPASVAFSACSRATSARRSAFSERNSAASAATDATRPRVTTMPDSLHHLSSPRNPVNAYRIPTIGYLIQTQRAFNVNVEGEIQCAQIYTCCMLRWLPGF